MRYVYLYEHSECEVGEWAHINGWIGRNLSRDVWDVEYVYLCEHSEYIVGEWAHINGWIRAYLISERLGCGVCISV